MSKMAESIDFKNIGYLKISFSDAELAPIRAEVAKISKEFETSKNTIKN
jgi:hypothetical protein